MTVLVAYASKHGSTQGIAEQLRQLGKETEAQSVEEFSDLESYEAFVIGSAIWLKEATEWLYHHQAISAGHPVWLFSSGRSVPRSLTEEQPKEMTEFQQATRPLEHRIFFGALERSHLSFAERVMVKVTSAIGKSSRCGR